jgi:aspartyl/asparaginyl beta-hydroxylase (cupin superfamily)
MEKKLMYILVVIVIIILLIICVCSYRYYKKPLKSSSWIDPKLFPEAKEIFDQRDVIKKELMGILNSDQWGIWSYDYKTTPQFTRMSSKEILDRIDKSKGKIGSTKGKASWRLFGLILNEKILDTSKYCPETLRLLLSSSNRILNAGFSLMEPGCYIGRHRDYNHAFYRLHIPLIIPKNNNKYSKTIINKNESKKDLAVLNVEDDYIIWKDNEYFIFDDTFYHDAWNNTKEMRIVMLIDILKDKKLNKNK